MERRKEMFYLMIHSTHFTLRLSGIRHMVKDHTVNKNRNLLLPLHGLLFFHQQQGIFNMYNLTVGILHTTAFVIPAVEQ